MERKLTRRSLGLAAAGSALVAAQSPPAQSPSARQPPQGPAAELEAALAAVQQRSEQMRKVKLPQLLEPGFAFRP